MPLFIVAGFILALFGILLSFSAGLRVGRILQIRDARRAVESCRLVGQDLDGLRLHLGRLHRALNENDWRRFNGTRRVDEPSIH